MGFNSLKIGPRLASGFGFVMLLIGLMAAAGVWRLQSVGDLTDTMVNDAMLKERLIGEWHSKIGISGTRVIAYAKNADQPESKVEAERAMATRTRANELQTQLEGILVSPGERALLGAVTESRKMYAATRDSVFQLKKAGDGDAVRKMVDGRLEPQFDAYLGSLAKMAEYQAKQSRALAAEVQTQYRSGQLFLLVLAGSAIVLGAWFSYVIAHSITAPLHRAVKIAQTVAAGDLTSQIDATSLDETGQLLRALKEMNDSLVGIVGRVRGGTHTIATASGEIASGNLDLSSRTEQQASSLQQTASSMEQLTSTVKQNDDHSRQAHALALSSSEIAAKGGAVVGEVVDTMSRINASARKIVDIVGVIDGIAFQTNILALNAAVEAARAGEQGRGFAVVAAEVRNLAQRSAVAAREIKELIGTSVEAVDAGARLVNQAGVTMEQIVISVRRVSDILGEISVASQAQTDGIEQINRAIAQMDEVTQQNAALVEESAAAAASLQEQSGVLAQVVSVFRLAPGGRGGARAPAALAASPALPRAATAASSAPTSTALAKRVGNGRVSAPEWEEF